jgi:hypothetical protein
VDERFDIGGIGQGMSDKHVTVRDASGGQPFSDAEVEELARAVFDVENGHAWDMTTEGLRAAYRSSVRRALAKWQAWREENQCTIGIG